jgi:protein gp37
VFVNSMSDLFQDLVPDGYIVSVAKVMMTANWHTFQVLTKRAGRLERLLREELRFAALAPHVWWGVSVEDRKYGVPRIDRLRAAPAAVRFLSIEPLLEDLGRLNLAGIDWVIVGGESGPGARPMASPWVEAIEEQCEKARVKFFFKQWGGRQKAKYGRILNGRTYDDMPPLTATKIPSRHDRHQLAVSLSAITGVWPSTPLVQLSASAASAAARVLV